MELSPPVVTTATGYFGFAPDERMRLTTGDALVALEAAPAHSYDVLFLDLFFDNGETPQHFLTDDFFGLCRSRLRPDGLLTMNLSANGPDFSQRLAPIAAHFATVYTCRGHGSTQIVFATDHPPLCALCPDTAGRRRTAGTPFHLPLCHLGFRLIQQRPASEAAQ